MNVSSHALCMGISMMFHLVAAYLVMVAVLSVSGSYLPSVFPAKIKHSLVQIRLASLAMHLAIIALDH